MAQVLITSKTSYGSTKCCVGGLLLSNNKYLRLLTRFGHYQDSDTPLNIGDIWDLTYSTPNNTIAPHHEDVHIINKKKVSTISNIKDYLVNQKVPIWKGDLDNIFDKKIRWTGSGNGYICERIGLPTNSVGFWIADEDMEFDGKSYTYSRDRKLNYKGTQSPIKIIPSETLIRLSLAKWWHPEDIDIEDRCYLQLSGWY